MSKSNLTELISVRTLEKILDNFSSATGLGCVIRDNKGNPLTKGSNPSRLWQEVIRHPNIEKQYHQYLVSIFEKVSKTGQNEIYRRYIDTYAFIVPIYIDGRAEAFFVGGLARFGNPNMEICMEESKKLNIDLDKFLEMYLMLPLVTNEKLEACANLLRIIGSTISTLVKEGSEAKAKLEELSEIQDFLEAKIQKNSRQLHESEERYRQLFNTINDGIYVTDENGIIKEINNTGAKLLGFNSPDDLIGTNMRNVYVNPEDRDEFTRILYWKGHIEHFHPYVKLPNGDKRYFETNSTIIKDKNGKIIGVQGIFRSIGPRHHCNLNQFANLSKNETDTTSERNDTDNKKTPDTTGRIRR